MKNVLMTATVPSMIGQFNMSNIEILQDLGYQVHIACNFKDTSVWTKERIKQFVGEMKGKNVICHQIDFSRSPLGIVNDIKSFRQMNGLFKKNNFSFVHCHTPVAGVITRIVTHKHRIKTIYTAHGFHFYDGAPKKNWIVFYPIEKFFSRWTDVLITITKEDYNRAKNKFNAHKTVYVPGVGVDVDKFANVNTDCSFIRDSFGLKPNDIMLLSVGELNANKNHSVVIKALGKLNDNRIHYCIAGTGGLKDELVKLSNENNVSKNVHLLGYRTDVPELLKASDIFILPSIREGLNVSLMEAMASGLPCICGNIRGNTDLIEDGKGGFLVFPRNVNEYSEKIKAIINKDTRSRMSDINRKIITEFDTSVVLSIMKDIYCQI